VYQQQRQRKHYNAENKIFAIENVKTPEVAFNEIFTKIL
jgi:hypothetical protein